MEEGGASVVTTTARNEDETPGGGGVQDENQRQQLRAGADGTLLGLFLRLLQLGLAAAGVTITVSGGLSGGAGFYPFWMLLVAAVLQFPWCLLVAIIDLCAVVDKDEEGIESSCIDFVIAFLDLYFAIGSISAPGCATSTCARFVTVSAALGFVSAAAMMVSAGLNVKPGESPPNLPHLPFAM